MGFFYSGLRSQARRSSSAKHIPIATMREMGCKACPLDKAKLTSPKMEAAGSSDPELYFLMGNPGAEEDARGEIWVGKSAKFLINQLSRNSLPDQRFNYIVQCHPPESRHPDQIELECCRKRVVADIEATQPKVIVGAGAEALTWATGMTSINNWRGRPLITKIGNHTCWYFPVFDPAFVLAKAGKYGPSEFERVLADDLRWIERNFQRMPTPRVYEAPYDHGIELIEGTGRGDLKRLEDAFNRLVTEPIIGLDLETSGLRPYAPNSMIYTCAVGTFDFTVAFPMDHPRAWGGSLGREVSGLFADFLLQSGRKYCHHLGFELEWLTYFYGRGVSNLTEWGDTLAMAHTIDERQGNNSLDDLTRQYFGFNLKAQSKVDVKQLLSYPLKDVLRYNGMDAKWTHLLIDPLQAKLDENRAYQEESDRKVRLAPALALTTGKGVLVDFEYTKKMEQKLLADIGGLEKKIANCREVLLYRNKFGAFNSGSPEHVIKLMRDICQRDEVKTAAGGYTSDEGALSKIPGAEVPSAPLILELRTISKLLSTYVAPVLERRSVYPDGRIHSTFSSMRAVTGRLASEDPNIQNFPKRKNKEVRGMIVASPGCWLTAIDYGQIEARVIAMASEDDNLVRYLWTGYDIHGVWADRFLKEYPRIKDWLVSEFGVAGDDAKLIRKTLRQEVKNRWVFPQFFGSSVRSCSEQLQVPESIGQILADEFWDEFRGVKRWQEKLIKGYERNLYVETLGGRRRRGPQTKNELINHPIQGTAADIVTESMAELSEYSVIHDDPDFQPNINVHDDLTFDLPDESLDEKLDVIAPIMCRHRFSYINVPLIIEVSVGVRWHELEEIAVYRSNELFNLRSPYGNP